MRKGVFYSVLVGLFLLLLLPFIFGPSLFFPFITGKAFYFRVIVEIIFSIWIAGCVFHKQLRPTKSVILYSLALFMVVFSFANIFGVNFQTSFWSNFERMEGYVTYLHLFALFLVAGSTIKEKKWWHYIFKTSIALSIAVSIHAILQFVDARSTGQFIRSFALFGNPIYLAEFLMVHIFLCIFFIRNAKNWMIGYYGVAILLNLIALFFTGTRGALLGLVGGFIVALILTSIFGKSEGSYRRLSVVALVIIVLAGGLFYSLKDTNLIQSNDTLKRFANTSLTEKTAQARFANWEIALDGFKERPILGWGQGNYNVIFDSRFNANVLYNQEQWFDHVHNIILDMMVAGGILGLLSYCLIFISLIYLIAKDRELLATEKSILIGLIAGYIIQNLFAFDNVISYVFFIFILSYIHGNNSSEGLLRVDKELPETKNNLYIVSVLGAILAISIICLVNYKPYQASSDVVKGMRFRGVDRTTGEKILLLEDGGYSYMKRAFDLGTFGNPEIFHRMIENALQIARTDLLSTEDKFKFIDLVNSSAQTVIENDPENSKNYFLYGRFLANIGDLEKAENALRRAIDLSPNKQSTRDLLTQILISKGDFEEAKIFAKETYEIEPEFDAAWVSYVFSLYVLSDSEEYDLLIKEAVDNLQFNRLKLHYGKMRVLYPDNYVWIIRLIEVLIKEGDFVNANKIINEGIQKFPQHRFEFERLSQTFSGPRS